MGWGGLAGASLGVLVRGWDGSTGGRMPLGYCHGGPRSSQVAEYSPAQASCSQDSTKSSLLLLLP